MKISVLRGSSQSEVNEVDVDFNGITRIITAHSWSPMCFNDGRRLASNFRETSLMVADVDGGLPLAQAQRILESSGLSAIIGTTRHHQMAKIAGQTTKPPADRDEGYIPKVATDRTMYYICTIYVLYTDYPCTTYVPSSL